MGRGKKPKCEKVIREGSERTGKANVPYLALLPRDQPNPRALFPVGSPLGQPSSQQRGQGKRECG